VISDAENSVVNEGFCLALALQMGLRPVAAQVHWVEGRVSLLIERYDQIEDDSGQRQQLRQEDFCQALGLPPELRYQDQGGPDLAQCFALLRNATHPSMPQILRFLDYVIFNALIGNEDAHGRSFSLLYFGKDAVLAPLHDVRSTAIYPGLRSGMAMRIGSSYRFSEVQLSDWVQLAQEAGLARELVTSRVREMSEELVPAARRLGANASQGFAGNPVVAQIIAVIEQRCAQAISA
jgi:serine/threonine-protein kinase HipA